MTHNYLQTILHQFKDIKHFSSHKISVGLINQVFKITDDEANVSYILRNINQEVFKYPLSIINNMQHVQKHLKKHNSDVIFTNLIDTKEGAFHVLHENEFYILMPFIADSVTHILVKNAEMVLEAAIQLGKFTKAVSTLSIDKLQYPILNFHHLGLRYEQFLQSLKTGNKNRIEKCVEEIKFLQSLEKLNKQYEDIANNKEFKLRPTHHDTKISNILFDKNEKSICLIDWDTLMPGYFISDIGDMCRTYCCSVGEEEADANKIFFKADYFEKILIGYLADMKEELSDTEKKHFIYSGKFMIYMQALRFLADYFNDDIYYTITYPENNYVRAMNQIYLLKDFIAKEPLLLQYQQHYTAS